MGENGSLAYHSLDSQRATLCFRTSDFDRNTPFVYTLCIINAKVIFV